MIISNLFSTNHIWLRLEENKAKIGISEYAQKKLGGILFVNLPDVGDELSLDEIFGDVESVKSVSDLISPVSGTVIQINDKLIDNPEVIDESPYESWMIEVDVKELNSDLIDENQYEEYLKTL